MVTPPYEITGSILLIDDVQTFPSGFLKREFVVQTEDEYPQPLKFECLKERAAQLDRLAVNDRVRVRFRIRGNAGRDGSRYFVSLQSSQVEKLEADGSSVVPEQPPPADDGPDPF